MNNLDNQKAIEKLDPSKVRDSIAELPLQIKEVVRDAKKIKLPKKYKNFDHVVVNGMGGSNIGAYIAKSLFADRLKVPVLIEPGYEVPKYINKNTLYIISSYSGTTEEPLSTYKEAKKRGAKIIAITSNSKGQLQKMMSRDRIPGLVFNVNHNPCGQPRLALGYSIFGIASLLKKAGVLQLKDSEIKAGIETLLDWNKKLLTEYPEKNNVAKKLALKLKNRMPVLVSAEFLNGNMHALRNQINETSKLFNSFLSMPDLNHHAMEGLAHPKSNQKNLMFVFFDSELHSKRVQLRSKLTKQVVKKNNIEHLTISLKGKTKFLQGLEVLQLGSWLTYYLGALYDVDPVAIPYVDWFKQNL